MITPNLVPAASTGDLHAFVDIAVTAAGAGEDTVVVGHSGAGAVLPLIADRLTAPRLQLMFVDAGIPPRSGTFGVAGAFLPTLQNLAKNGVLPRWSSWWGEGVMEALIPDAERRHQVEQELPQVPLSFYDTPIEAPTDWRRTACSYLLLSNAYEGDANSAASLGWPVVERRGGHLDIVNDDGPVAATLIELANRRRSR